MATQQVEISHVSLEKYLATLRQLKKEVERKSLQRLQYEGLTTCESVTNPSSKYFNDPAAFAYNKYAYYVCYKCSKVSPNVWRLTSVNGC